MGRIKLILGWVAVMAAMMVALAAPALAKDNHDKGDGNNHRIEQRLDRIDNRIDRLDDRFFVDDFDVDLVSDVDFEPGFVGPWRVYRCEGPVCLID